MLSKAVQRFKELNDILAGDRKFFKDGQVDTIDFDDKDYCKDLASRIESAGVPFCIAPNTCATGKGVVKPFTYALPVSGV